MDARERFLKYVSYNTASEEGADSSPSTERQKDLGYALMDEMKELGLLDVSMDSCGNVVGTLPALGIQNGPVLGLIAHMDTSPEASGQNVRPSVVRYDGGDIQLCDGVATTEAFCPGLSHQAGMELIVTDGTTLLGADDKAGIAEIMAAVERLKESNLPHIELRLVFTTDEEVGRGTEGLDIAGLKCDYAYTVDGGPVGEVVYENFNAADGDVEVKGVGVHTGSAKGIMINAAAVAMEFHSLLPESEVPEKTEGYEGFFHLGGMEGCVTEARLHYIIRDHDREAFERRKELFLECAGRINERYGAGTVRAVVKDTYYNMRESLLPHMHLIDRAKAAFIDEGVEPFEEPVRGGTDGAHLSLEGLPCPNLSTGGYSFHGVREWIPVESLKIMTRVLLRIIYSFNK